MSIGRTNIKHKGVSSNVFANKYGCSREYVEKVRKAGGQSVLAKKILKDAEDIEYIYNRDTKITV